MSGKEDREQPRIDERSTIFIETVAASDISAQQESILICNSVEMSTNGLRVCVDDELEVGTLLQLGIQLPELEQPLYVVGDVRWCKPAHAPDTGYYVGFKLLESDSTDFEIWSELLQDMT